MHNHTPLTDQLSGIHFYIAANDLITTVQYWIFAAIVLFTLWKLRKRANQAWLKFLGVLAVVFAACASTGYLPEFMNRAFSWNVDYFKAITGTVLNFAAFGLNYYLIKYNSLARWAEAQDELRKSYEELRKQIEKEKK